MKFKTPSLRTELECLPPLLRLIIEEFERASLEIANVEPVVTRIFGRIDGDSGVHSQYRAIDFRDEYDGRFLYTKDQRETLIERIESKFPRGDKKPTIIWHSFKEAPYHFHVQTSFNPHVYASMLQPRFP